MLYNIKEYAFREKTGRSFSENYTKNPWFDLFKRRLACPKPYLSDDNIKAHYEKAKKWIYYSETHWKQVIYLDKTKLNFFGSDGKKYFRRKDGTRYQMKN
ncbi:hypothetical protein ENBRE01_1739 [Enteropsectra breve]|nr:hypothetical protein ENBRE01_1739 [Enteropsectra breve]